jgi:hypothetical protein
MRGLSTLSAGKEQKNKIKMHQLANQKRERRSLWKKEEGGNKITDRGG